MIQLTLERPIWCSVLILRCNHFLFSSRLVLQMMAHPYKNNDRNDKNNQCFGNKGIRITDPSMLLPVIGSRNLCVQIPAPELGAYFRMFLTYSYLRACNGFAMAPLWPNPSGDPCLVFKVSQSFLHKVTGYGDGDN